jgi:hypothetical protein
MNTAFEVHKLNEGGIQKANQLAAMFDALLDGVGTLVPTTNREYAIVRTKLEEACFFAKKGMANQPENQQ